MIRFIIYLALLVFTLLNTHIFACASKTPEPSIEKHLNELVVEVSTIKLTYRPLFDNINAKLSVVSFQLKSEVDLKKQVALLIKKDALKEERELILLSENSKISKVRFLKGLQIIKILYEKTLSLDHHFSSVATLNDINKISNPNYYPEFVTIKESINNKKNKNDGFDLSAIMGSNIYTSVIHSFVSMFTNTASTKEEKDTNMKEVECILDFTLRMHNDLNTIYFETVFLQKSNENVMENLQQLFVDYTKPINYTTGLKECRQNDDWDQVRSNLGDYLSKMDSNITTENDKNEMLRMLINLEFSIDRLLQFITQYNAFIDQGGKFYEKFQIMLNSYENEVQCANKVPIEYQTLKNGVSVAVEKFKTAYKPVEINGSKMKEVLYGLNEYE